MNKQQQGITLNTRRLLGFKLANGDVKAELPGSKVGKVVTLSSHMGSKVGKMATSPVGVNLGAKVGFSSK